MAECANRHGSEIAGVPAEGIEALISAEKLRGTDFCVGAIGAITRRPNTLNFLTCQDEVDLGYQHSVWYSIGTRRSGNPLWDPIALRAWI